MVAIERFALQAAILDECQNHLEGGERLGAEERKIEAVINITAARVQGVW